MTPCHEQVTEVTFTVTGDDDVEGITITGDRSGAIHQKGVSCTTDASGSCTIEDRARQNETGSATFTVAFVDGEAPDDELAVEVPG